ARLRACRPRGSRRRRRPCDRAARARIDRDVGGRYARAMLTRGLYAIVDPAATRDRDPLRVTEAILRGGCARLQLRAKSIGDRDHLGLARAIRARCRAAGVPFVMNDRADLAVL